MFIRFRTQIHPGALTVFTPNKHDGFVRETRQTTFDEGAQVDSGGAGLRKRSTWMGSRTGLANGIRAPIQFI